MLPPKRHIDGYLTIHSLYQLAIYNLFLLLSSTIGIQPHFLLYTDNPAILPAKLDLAAVTGQMTNLPSLPAVPTLVTSPPCPHS